MDERPNTQPIDVSNYNRFGIAKPVGTLIGSGLFLLIFVPMLRPWQGPPEFSRSLIAFAVAGFGSALLYVAVSAAYSLLVLRRANPELQAAAFAAGVADDRAAVEAHAAAKDRALVDAHPYGRRALAPVAAPPSLTTLPDETFYWRCARAALIGDVEHSRIEPYGFDEGEVHRSVRREPVDRGDLYVSDKRLVFLGAKELKTYAFDDVARIVPQPDGVRIEVANRPVAEFLTGSEKDGVVVLRVSRGLLGDIDQHTYEGLIAK